jgi:two-component system cell cycle response regulator DivK
MTSPRKRLLLVDDYKDALEMWTAFLTASGYDVIAARDGLEAVERAEQQRPDIVVLDLQLPEMSGIEVARKLRASKKTAGVPLVAVTGFSQECDHQVAREAGFDAVIVKPCDPPVLLAELSRLLAEGEPASS